MNVSLLLYNALIPAFSRRAKALKTCRRTLGWGKRPERLLAAPASVCRNRCPKRIALEQLTAMHPGESNQRSSVGDGDPCHKAASSSSFNSSGG
jgi:hypothetical protein